MMCMDDGDDREAAETMAAACAYTGVPFPSKRCLMMMSHAIRALDKFRASKLTVNESLCPTCGQRTGMPVGS